MLKTLPETKVPQRAPLKSLNWMDHFFQLIHDNGDLIYVITAVWTFFEGETFVLFGGYAASLDLLNPIGLLIAAWGGSFLGDQCWFYIGRRYGCRLLRRFPKWEPGLEVALDYLEKYNTKFILSFRFIYGIRNVSSIACGMSKLTWRRFAILNFIAAGIWAAAFVAVGYLFGHVSEKMLGSASRVFSITMLGVFALAVWFVVRRGPQRLKHEAEEAGRHLTRAEVPSCAAYDALDNATAMLPTPVMGVGPLPNPGNLAAGPGDTRGRTEKTKVG